MFQESKHIVIKRLDLKMASEQLITLKMLLQRIQEMEY
jgi:hypothetical protein